MNRFHSLFIPVVILLMLSGCAMTSVRQHPDFATGKRKVETVAIIPVDVEYRHLVFTGENERDSEKEKSIGLEIESNLATMLNARGYSVKADLVKRAASGDKDFNFKLEQIKEAYTQSTKELYAQPMVSEEQSTQFKVGVGALANPVAMMGGSDALILARYQGFDKSSGLVAKEVVASALLAALTGAYVIPAPSGGRIEISLIDGVSGNVLWTNFGAGATTPSGVFNLATQKFPLRLNGSKDAAVAQPANSSTPATLTSTDRPATEPGANQTSASTAP